MDVCRRSSQYREESTVLASLALFLFLNSMLGDFSMLMIKETLATSEASLQAQVAQVNKFVTSNFQQLNLTKCKIVVIRTREWHF